MLRRVARVSSSAVGGSAGQRPQQRQHAGAVRLERVEASHQQIEQPVARGPVGGCVGQRRLVREPTEAQQDRGTAGEALAGARQRQAGGAGRAGDADRAPAFRRSLLEGGSDQSAIECGIVHGPSWRSAPCLTTPRAAPGSPMSPTASNGAYSAATTIRRRGAMRSTSSEASRHASPLAMNASR